MVTIGEVEGVRLTWGESTRWDDRRQRLYVVDCASEDAAIDVARDLRLVNPTAVYEIRPIQLYLPGAVIPETAAEE